MKLFLTSSGNTNKSIEKELLNLLGKPFAKSHLTFVPTAANVEEGDKTRLPHLNSKWFPKVRLDFLEKLSKETPNTFYAIDDGTAVKVVDGKISIISEGEWRKFN